MDVVSLGANDNGVDEERRSTDENGSVNDPYRGNLSARENGVKARQFEMAIDIHENGLEGAQIRDGDVGLIELLKTIRKDRDKSHELQKHPSDICVFLCRVLDVLDGLNANEHASNHTTVQALKGLVSFFRDRAKETLEEL